MCIRDSTEEVEAESISYAVCKYFGIETGENSFRYIASWSQGKEMCIRDRKYNCQLTRLDFQQEEGLISCLPLGLNQIEIQRGLTTSSTAIFVPFTTPVSYTHLNMGNGFPRAARFMTLTRTGNG